MTGYRFKEGKILDLIDDRMVKTRKKHNCWGCTKKINIGETVRMTLCVDVIIQRAWWCEDCIELMDSLEEWQKEDGFTYGELLNFKIAKKAYS